MNQDTLSRIIPARRETVKFLWIRRPFLEMCQEYRDARKRLRKSMDSCFWCEHKFIDGEQMNLAARDRGGNVLLCNGCADTAQTGRAPTPVLGQQNPA